MTIKSFAKINVGLKIIGRREGGYHLIKTVFQRISLHDVIYLGKIHDGWKFTSNSNSLPHDESNLCVISFLKVKELFPSIGGISIKLEKNIPVGSGLGGGSSNAASVLKGLNEVYSLGLSTKSLLDIALSIGADVPFFIDGGTQLGEGIGEELSEWSLPEIRVVLLVVPPVSISTEWAYGHIKIPLTEEETESNFATAQLSLTWNKADTIFENDFESLVFQAYPEIGDIKRRLQDSGALFASLSGSGSTVFGIFENEQTAQQTRNLFDSSFQTYITYPIIK